MINTIYYKAGILEVITGPMKSGKSSHLITRVEKLRYAHNINFQLFKPRLDKRFSEMKIVSRRGDSIDSTIINEENPQEILKKLEPNIHVIAIDEAHFFNNSLIDIIKNLIFEEKNLIIAGLDLDFRGEPFGCMPYILSLADEVSKLSGFCDYPGCNNKATRTQRLINGEPAHYDSPLIVVGGDELYEVRCLKHHIVPKQGL